MSTSDQTTSADSRFWCHQCRAEIRPTSDFACPSCGNDFIEQMEDMVESPEDDPSLFVAFEQFHPPSTQPAQNQAQQAPMFQTMFGTPAMAAQPVDLIQLFQQVDTMLQHIAAPPGMAGVHHQQPPVMQVFTTGGGTTPMNFETFMQNMFSNLGIQGMVGNPGDYAFGSLDNIITRLMETAGDRGPPPAAPDVVESLPVERIAQEAVDAHEACPVCKDEYNLDEEVIKLECEHRFHPTCIKEWLGRRNTCPVCRFQLKPVEKHNGGNSGDNNNGRPGGSGREGNPHNSADSPMRFYM